MGVSVALLLRTDRTTYDAYELTALVGAALVDRGDATGIGQADRGSIAVAGSGVQRYLRACIAARKTVWGVIGETATVFVQTVATDLLLGEGHLLADELAIDTCVNASHGAGSHLTGEGALSADPRIALVNLAIAVIVGTVTALIFSGGLVIVYNTVTVVIEAVAYFPGGLAGLNVAGEHATFADAISGALTGADSYCAVFATLREGLVGSTVTVVIEVVARLGSRLGSGSAGLAKGLAGVGGVECDSAILRADTFAN